MKIAIVIALLSVSALAAPFGTIVCSIGTTADFRVVALNAADGAQQVLATGATVFAGLDGAPWCGDPCVAGRRSAAGACLFVPRRQLQQPGAADGVCRAAAAAWFGIPRTVHRVRDRC